MENKLKVDISIEDTPISTFTSFSLHQRFNEHHTFELRFNQDQVELPGALSLNRSKNFIGKSLMIEFGNTPGSENRFSGIITNVEVSQAHGFMGDIIISGFSPTILIDRGPDLGSYLGKDLRSIISQATKEVPANDLDLEINPNRKATIDYLIQYRESDFEFINRLSAQYHEWFFYNGTRLVFGKPDELKAVKLIYGRDLNNIRYGMKIAPLKYKKFAYNPKQDELLAANGEGKGSGSADMEHVIAASNSVYSKSYNQPLITRVDNKMEIDRFVKNEQESIISGLLQITGKGDNPQVAIGSIVDISMSVRKANDFSLEDFGKFLVTEVSHHIDGVGHYNHTFQAIPADTDRVPVNQVNNPQPDMQLANVVNTNDPDGHGRIKVKFKWACDCNDVTEWLRVLTPDAGSSDKVGKNRGFVFIPEIGDQVVVAFEEGNIARPIIMGSVFHGKSGSGGGQSNNEKSLTSKSGNKLQMNDDKGSINLTDSGTANLSFDGAGNAVTNAANSKTINVGGDKDSPPQSIIKADAEGNIVLDAKTSITLKVGDNLLSINKEGLIKLNGKDLKQTVENNYDLDAKKVTQSAKGANFKINSDQNVIVSGGIEVKLK
jgi:type VI secretion system secreted protein VgrG